MLPCMTIEQDSATDGGQQSSSRCTGQKMLASTVRIGTQVPECLPCGKRLQYAQDGDCTFSLQARHLGARLHLLHALF